MLKRLINWILLILLNLSQSVVLIIMIHIGIWPESPSFSDTNMPAVPAGWKGKCQSGETFNASTCNRLVCG